MISLLTLFFIFDKEFRSGRSQMIGKIPFKMNTQRNQKITKEDSDSLSPNVAMQPEFSLDSYIVSTLLISKNKTQCLIEKEIFDACILNPSGERCKDIPAYDLKKNYFYHCTDFENIYEDAKKIRSDSYDLVIESTMNISDIDLGKLNHKRIPISLNKYEHFSYLNGSSHSEDVPFSLGIRNSNQEKLYLNIVCNVYTWPLQVTVLGSPLNVYGLSLMSATFTSNSEKINADNFSMSMYELNENSIILDKVNIKQFTIQTSESYECYDNNVRISYNQSQVEFYLKKIIDKEFRSQPECTLKYDKCEKIILSTYTNYIEFYVENMNITKIKDTDISIFDPGFMVVDRIRDGTKHNVTLATTGNWSGIKDKVKVNFISYKDYVSLENKCNSNIEVQRIEVDYFPISPSDESKRENQKLNDVEIKGETPEELKTNIETVFSENQNKNDKLDYIVELSSNQEDQKPIVLNNLELKPNEFIKIKSDPQQSIEVELNKGNLNLLMDSNSEVSIKVDDPENVNLTIKNQAESTIIIDAAAEQNTKQNVSIKANSEIYQPLTLKVGDNVKSIKIDSINLHKSGDITVEKDEKSDATVTLGSLTAHPKESGSLNNIEIDEKLTVSQSASLNLNNVKLENSELELNIISYNNADFKTPLLSGNLGTKPKKITLTNLKDESPVKDAEYLLFEGNFENGCESWADSIDLDGNQFDEKVCKTFEDQRLQEYHGSLFVKSTGNKKDENDDKNDDENDEGNDDNKSSKGLIIGVVIGCIAAVAIIIVIVVVVIRKKNQMQNRSSDIEIDTN